jgi:hypothetical protein
MMSNLKNNIRNSHIIDEFLENDQTELVLSKTPGDATFYYIKESHFNFVKKNEEFNNWITMIDMCNIKGDLILIAESINNLYSGYIDGMEELFKYSTDEKISKCLFVFDGYNMIPEELKQQLKQIINDINELENSECKYIYVNYE